MFIEPEKRGYIFSHNDKPVTDNGAKCSLRRGWRTIGDKWGNELISRNVTNPMQFECRSGIHHKLK